MATTSTEDRQVELAQAHWVGEYVDLDDLVTPDREAHDRKRPPSWKPRNDSCGPVHQRPLRELGKLREAERLLGHCPRTANLLRRTRRHATAIAQGERVRARADILEVLASRFDPPISEYHKVEQRLTTIDEITRLSDLHRRALRVADLAAFLRELSTGPESEN